jgi:hypothetical protein
MQWLGSYNDCKRRVSGIGCTDHLYDNYIEFFVSYLVAIAR